MKMTNVLATDDNINVILMGLQQSTDVAVDTETSGLDVRNKTDYLMGVCVDTPMVSAYIPFRHNFGNVSMRYFQPLIDLLAERELIWHNRKYDYHSFKTMGVDPLTTFTKPSYCTLLIAQLVNEEVPSKELDFLAKWYLRKEKANSDIVHKLGDIYGYGNLEANELFAEYGATDATLTRQLRDFLWPRLVRDELQSVYWDTESPFSDLLYQLEQRGVGINRDLAVAKRDRGRSRMASIVREVGFTPSAPTDLKRVLLQELKLPVLAHTSSCKDCKQGKPVDSHEGNPSFNKNVMADYDDILQASSNPLAQLITEYRGWQKATTSLYEPILEKAAPDGFLRTEFKQHGTVTGRLSANNPNLQQVPRGSKKVWNGDAKSCFTSGREGFILYGWDYSQVELRLAASYGQESLLLTEFSKEKSDPFNVLAPIIFGELTESTRHDTKTFVYANLYGAGLAKIAATLGRPQAEVRPLFERYKASISGIISISERVTGLVESRGWIRYWDGRRRHMKNRGDAYKAWNSLVQGGGAQLVKKAMLRCREFEDENCFMVLTVHDEITFCIRPEMIPDYEPRIVKAMTDWDLGVRLAVDGKEWK